MNAKEIENMRKNGAKIGQGVDIVGSCNFGSEPYLITIGDKTTISFDVAFVNHDGATRVLRNLTGNKDMGLWAPITIGENCFIGCRSTILAGVTIGDNTIIGAGSVVNKSIPDNVVAAGVPCKVICTLDEYKEKHKDDFMNLATLTPEQRKEKLLEIYK